jgi:hypothetical protein
MLTRGKKRKLGELCIPTPECRTTDGVRGYGEYLPERAADEFAWLISGLTCVPIAITRVVVGYAPVPRIIISYPAGKFKIMDITPTTMYTSQWQFYSFSVLSPIEVSQMLYDDNTLWLLAKDEYLYGTDLRQLKNADQPGCFELELNVHHSSFVHHPKSLAIYRKRVLVHTRYPHLIPADYFSWLLPSTTNLALPPDLQTHYLHDEDDKSQFMIPYGEQLFFVGRNAMYDVCLWHWSPIMTDWKTIQLPIQQYHIITLVSFLQPPYIQFASKLVNEPITQL